MDSARPGISSVALSRPDTLRFVPQGPSLLAFVDYFNVASFRPGAERDFSDHEGALDSIVGMLLTVPQALKPPPAELRIRLYGGWADAQTQMPTRDRDLLGVIVERHFPRRRPYRVLVEFAESLLALPRERLADTMRPWRGFVPFQLVSGSLCPLDQDQCAVRELEEWRRGRCPLRSQCGRDTEDVVRSNRQKLIDTGLVTDLLTATNEGDLWLAAVSNDDDVIPAVIAARMWTDRALLIRMRRRTPSVYDALLARNRFAVIDL